MYLRHNIFIDKDTLLFFTDHHFEKLVKEMGKTKIIKQIKY